MHISFLFRIVTTLITVIAITSVMTSYAGRKLSDYFLSIGETQTNKVTYLVTLNSVSNLIKESYSQVDFIIDESDVVFNSGELNMLLKDSVNLIYHEMKNVEYGKCRYLDNQYGNGIIYEMPLNMIFGNSLLNNFGPRLPVKYSLIGDIKGEIASEVEEFGINNAIVNIVLEITILSRVSIPLISNMITSKIKIPVFSKMHVGKIPNVFYGPIEGVNAFYSQEVEV